MSRWRRFLRRRRIIALLYGFNAYRLAWTVTREGKHELLTTHAAVSKALFARQPQKVTEVVAAAAYKDAYRTLQRAAEKLPA